MLPTALAPASLCFHSLLSAADSALPFFAGAGNCNGRYVMTAAAALAARSRSQERGFMFSSLLLDDTTGIELATILP